ncbi:hypothetical protein GCM10027403_14640 [Arthrobacter tecti]
MSAPEGLRRQQLAEKVRSVSTGMIRQCLADLERPDRDAAESNVFTELSVEDSRRRREWVRTESDSALAADLRRLDALTCRDIPKTEQNQYWAVFEELERRHPEAGQRVDAWLDTLTAAQTNADGGMGLQLLKEIGL